MKQVCLDLKIPTQRDIIFFFTYFKKGHCYAINMVISSVSCQHSVFEWIWTAKETCLVWSEDHIVYVTFNPVLKILF